MRPLSLLAALLVLLLNACYSAGDGKPPPLEELYFPTGLALDHLPRPDHDGAPKYLYVVNSDFDLQYRAASMISYDLDKLRDILPRSCNRDGDCQGDDMHSGYVCDVPGVGGAARVPSYYCVNPSTTVSTVNQRTVERPCGAFGNLDEADQVLTPGLCKAIEPTNPQDGSPSVLVNTVGIGAFATDVIWRANPDQSAARLFVPVRGDSTLHWIDVKDGKFECGQNGDPAQGCDEVHQAGDEPSANVDNLTQPPEPYALDATANGAYVAVTNQTSGTVSLFANAWEPPGAAGAPKGGPRLVSILGGLSLAPVGIVALPEPLVADGAETPESGFLVAYRTAAQIDLLRVHAQDADTSTAGLPYTGYTLSRAGAVPINANSLGFDSRGITIDDSQRQKDYEACDCTGITDGGELAKCQADRNRCLRAVHQPAVYVASRAPASLLVGAMTTDVGYPSGTSELPSFTDSIPLTFGPSRVIMGDVKVPGTTYSDRTGTYDLERRVFVVCFDSRRIFVYDPKRRVIDSIISTGRGPYALAVDAVRGLAYVGHFTDSYLGVVSLDQRFPQTYATIVASIGAPKAPRSSK